jgi:multiple sugar transport system substrate-binding protein
MAEKITRRAVLQGGSFVALSAFATGVLAACSTPSTSGGGSTGAAGSGGGGGKDFSFFSWDTTPETPLSQMATSWSKSADFTLKLTTIPGADYDTKLLTLFSGGNVPDIIRINDDYVNGYNKDGQLLDLTPYLKKAGIKADDYFDAAYNFPKQADGAYPAWPIGSTPGLMYYNVDAFNKAGIPLPPKDWSSEGWTWDDVVTAAHALTDEAAGTWGILAFPDTSCETIFPVSNGGPGIYSKDGQTFTLAEEKGYEAIQWVADLALKEKVHPPFSEVLASRTTPNWALNQFATGKVAMLVATGGGIPYIRDNATIKWDIAPTPAKVAQTTVNTLTVLSIPKKSKNPDAAWDMMQYATSDEGGKLMASTLNLLPVKKSVAAEITVDAKGPANFALVQQAIDNSVNENFGPYIQRARTIYRPVLDSVWSGDKTAKQALGEVKDQVDAVLQGKAS